MLQSQALQNFPYDTQNAGIQLVRPLLGSVREAVALSFYAPLPLPLTQISRSWDSGSLEWVNVPKDDSLLLPASIDGWTTVSSSTKVDSVNSEPHASGGTHVTPSKGPLPPPPLSPPAVGRSTRSRLNFAITVDRIPDFC